MISTAVKDGGFYLEQSKRFSVAVLFCGAVDKGSEDNYYLSYNYIWRTFSWNSENFCITSA